MNESEIESLATQLTKKIFEKKKENTFDRLYLDKIVKFLPIHATRTFDAMYPSGVSTKQLKWAISQVERTLESTLKSYDENNELKKESEEKERLLNKRIEKINLDIKEYETTISRMSNPIDINNANVQDKLFWLSCLESAGVDNWEGIDYALELYEENDE